MSKNTNDLQEMRHSLAHLLAAAVIEIYPTTLLTIGPAVDNGFYYDMDFESPISEKDFPTIEKKMRSLLKTWKGFTHKEVSVEEARTFFADNPYKLELIEEINKKGEKITLYTSGNFTDLCRGGHVEDMQTVPADCFELSRIAGAYWRGKEENKMLTRIYGLAFNSKDELETYKTQQEEAKKRDHRKLGKEMAIFEFDEDVGAGLPLWLPNGGAIIEQLETLAKETEFAYEYERVRTPQKICI